MVVLHQDGQSGLEVRANLGLGFPSLGGLDSVGCSSADLPQRRPPSVDHANGMITLDEIGN
jgi:hypothetical protein